jgi:hypothetical protein
VTLLIFLLLLVLSACSVVEDIAPPPPDTPVPTAPAEAPTPRPTLGEREFIDAVFCWESHIDEGEFNLIRFFPSGDLIDVYVQPYDSCESAWAATRDYLTEESLMRFNHGTYHLSGEWIAFTLSPANSSEVVGEVTGTYGVVTMRLARLGSEARDYILLEQGD